MIEKIKNVFMEFLKNKNYIIDNFSFDERLKLSKKIEELMLTGNTELEEIFFNIEIEELKFFTCEEALKILLDKIAKNEKIDIANSYFDVVMMLGLDNNGYKIFLEHYADSIEISNLIYIIINNIKSSQLKLHYYEQYKDNFSFRNFISLLEKLDQNLNFDKVIIEKFEKTSLDEINHLQYSSDFNKVIYMIKNPKERLRIILKNFIILTDREKILKDTLKLCSDEIILPIINDFESSEDSFNYLFYLIASLKSDNLKFEYVKKNITNSHILDVILSLKNDLNKTKIFKLILNDEKVFNKENLLANILMSIKDENLMFENLNYAKKYYLNYTNFFFSIKTDKQRKKIFEKFEKTNNLLASVVPIFDDDTIKLDYLNKYLNIMNNGTFVKIVISFKSDSLKLNYINNYNFNMLERQKIIESINDIEIRMDTIVNEAINKKIFGWLHSRICHDEELLDCKKINYELIKFYSSENNLNYENLKILVEKYGYLILRYYDNQNINKLINSDKEIFEKFLNLFNNEKFVMLNASVVDSIYDSLIKKIYKNSNPDVFDMFVEIKKCSEEKDVDKLIIKLKEIYDFVDLEQKTITINELTSLLLENETREYALNIVSELVNKYKIKKRNSYFEERKKNKMFDLNANIKYERNYFIKTLLENLDEEGLNKLKVIIKNIDLSKLDKDSVELLKNENIVFECIKFKMNPRNYKGDLDKIKKNIKQFNIIFEFLYDMEYESLKKIISYHLDHKKKVLDFNNFNSEKTIKIFLELDIDMLKDNLFNNEYLLDELSKILFKYKILGWNDIFKKLHEEANIEFDESTIASLIKYFYKFYPKMLENTTSSNITLFELINESNLYNSTSNAYKNLLGSEDYSLIVKNPPRNSANVTSAMERLVEIPSLIKKMYNRKFITIPPMRENIKIDETKNLNVTIGNTTDIINFTYGERTGACMRIKGQADSLFRFCLENENGFHIMITNPETNELVSRVSCFRNGNTLFLNQLRKSLDRNYSDFDLINLIKKVSQIIIDKTRNSEYPIENVIISSGEAMKTGENNEIFLDESPKSGYPNLYSDVDTHNAVLLASSSKDGSMVKLNLGPKKNEKYPVLRQKIKCFTEKKEIIQHIQKIILIRNIIKEEQDWMECDLELIDFDSIERLFVGEDWYIALDANNNIIDQLYIERDLNKVLNEINFVKENFINIDQKKDEEGFVL